VTAFLVVIPGKTRILISEQQIPRTLSLRQRGSKRLGMTNSGDREVQKKIARAGGGPPERLIEAATEAASTL